MDTPSKWVYYDGFLLIYVIQKMIFTACTLSCPVPGGIFTPNIAFGAVFGQLYVSTLIKMIEFFGFSSDLIQYRGVYSILGAAAMTASVTRTVSVAVIVLELNGHLSHAVPLMVCVLSSYAVSEYLKPESFFEMLSKLGGLDKKMEQKGNIIVRDVLDVNPEYKSLEFLSLSESTEQDMIQLIQKNLHSKTLVGFEENEGKLTFKLKYIPVVDSKRNMNLLFMINVDELKEYCEKYIGPFGPDGEV
mmetsp:Transcript_637/g.730  ORF Transcript_637/g.730 Transcript_637/m.730 type:complete len:246 (+) Transcript_637:1054-1791(+)